MSELAWIGERVPGDPRFVRLLSRGDVAMPALTTPRAKWEARQAEIINDQRARARMLLPIFDQFIGEVGPRVAAQPLTELRDYLAEMAEGGDE